ncbi:F-box only protein 8 [Exaiptasia diaphana]|uniref:F-box protein 8 n=1 Tax=Exaiptasia diaphana TaxID=2652724 RepID=A0A913XTZ1_EXADI|nr:F-box only protein 8 [Exaiptasia diaphana]KXJ24535.1 F-box only protein 8 [Exaiptasia diaphana]
MGQFHGILLRRNPKSRDALQTFTDLDNLPPELAVAVLSNLNATDLCLAACVWEHLANNNLLWMSLCRTTWRYSSAYKAMHKSNMTYKSLYLLLDDGTCLFNVLPKEGILFLIKNNIIKDTVKDITLFINGATVLRADAVRDYLKERRDVLDELVSLQSYTGMFLPEALRKFFDLIQPPEARNEYLDTLLELFSRRYLRCNPGCELSQDTVFILCNSLLLLSVDLSSPKVKNKMTKREFIKNLRGVVHPTSVDFIGDLYDDIYLRGHVAVPKSKCLQSQTFPCVRPYGNIFLTV